MALKLVKEWVIKNCADTQESFKDFVALAGKKN